MGSRPRPVASPSPRPALAPLVRQPEREGERAGVSSLGAGSDGEARDFWRRDSISSILHISRVFCYLRVVARSPNEGQDGATVVWRSKKRRTKRGKEATYLF